jgi:hypothetical protein
MAAKTGTYTLIASNTLGSATSSVTFSSIPTTYTDLILIANYALTTNGSSTLLRVNSDSGSNYSGTGLYGDGTSAGSFRDTSASSARIMTFANNTGSQMWIENIIHFMDYVNTTTYKTILVRDVMPNRGTSAVANLWRGSTGSASQAINSITITSSTGNIDVNSTFKLYGIEAGNL